MHRRRPGNRDGGRAAQLSRGVIRRATPAEAGALTDLATRSKAYWGYDPELVAGFREQLTLAPEAIATDPTYVLEAGGELLGFYRLNGSPPEDHLEDLFVSPGSIRRGAGKRLWVHALATATDLGFKSVVLESDPFAEGFYLAMGAERIGEEPSPGHPQRILPVMRYRLG